jgi:hypothetical protein
MSKIKSITEAYSQQPSTMSVLNENHFASYYDKPNACKEIKFETIQIGFECGDAVECLYCVGYNFDGKKLFQYKANAVNIHFFID